MFKKIMKYLLPLSIVLFLGYSFLYANTQEGNKWDSLNKTVFLTDYSSLGFFQDSCSNTLTPSLEVKKEVFKICTSDNEELEEDEFVPLKKELKNITFFSSDLYAQKIGSLCNNITKRVFFYKHLAFFASNKLYVIFRVFRI